MRFTVLIASLAAATSLSLAPAVLAQQNNQQNEQIPNTKQNNRMPKEMNQYTPSGAAEKVEKGIDRGTANGTQSAAATVGSPSEFVNKAAMGNMFEIQSGKLAQDRTANKNVAGFAKAMVHDHGKLQSQLEDAAKQANVRVPDKLDQEHQAKLDKLRNASNGDQFDKAYLDMQRQAHETDLQLMTSYAQHGESQQLKQVASEAAPVIREHLRRLKDMQSQ